MPRTPRDILLKYRTHRELQAAEPEDQRAYWLALFNAWSVPNGLDIQRDHQLDHDDARRSDWVRV